MSEKQIYSLCFKADLVGCYALQLYRGFDHPDHKFTFKLLCGYCKTNVKEVTMTLREVQAEPHGKEAKMLSGFGGPHFPGGMPGVPNGYTEMMRFEIDGGATPYGYIFGGNWEVTYHGKIFRYIDLTDHFEPTNIRTADWDEFDGVEARVNPPPAIEPNCITISEPVAVFFKKEAMYRD